MPVRSRGLVAVDGYLGVDPGAGGGLALLNGHRVGAVAMPASLPDLWEWLRWATGAGRVVACLEKVGGWRSDNPAAGVGSAMFKFGASYGSLEMGLVAAGIKFDRVPPVVWQRGVGVSPRKKGEGRTAYKNRLKARAQELFPGEAVTLATADALLLAEYCRRTRNEG